MTAWFWSEQPHKNNAKVNRSSEGMDLIKGFFNLPRLTGFAHQQLDMKSGTFALL